MSGASHGLRLPFPARPEVREERESIDRAVWSLLAPFRVEPDALPTIPCGIGSFSKPLFFRTGNQQVYSTNCCGKRYKQALPVNTNHLYQRISRTGSVLAPFWLDSIGGVSGKLAAKCIYSTHGDKEIRRVNPSKLHTTTILACHLTPSSCWGKTWGFD